MPELDEPTPGTTDEVKPDDAAAGAGASDADADGSAEDTSREEQIAKLEREKQQLLSQKTKWEETDRRLQELERERATPPPPATGDDAQRAAYEADLRLEDEIIAGIQPTVDHIAAAARLSRYREQVARAAVRRTEQKVEVVRLPADLQEEAEKLAREEGISVKLAARLLKAERAVEAKADDADTDEERIQRQTAKRDRTPATTSRAVGADEAGRFLSRADYNRGLDKLREADDMRGAAEYIKKHKGRVRG
jgi:hypothetical protein